MTSTDHSSVLVTCSGPECNRYLRWAKDENPPSQVFLDHIGWRKLGDEYRCPMHKDVISSPYVEIPLRIGEVRVGLIRLSKTGKIEVVIPKQTLLQPYLDAIFDLARLNLIDSMSLSPNYIPAIPAKESRT